jgi:putative transposon-encoded protein
MEKQQFVTNGYGIIEKKAKIIGHSSYVITPKAWNGKKVVVILVEE